MCYNKEASITVFIYSVILTFFLWNRNYPNDRFMALISLAVAAIQFTEFLMWSDQKCNKLNHYATIATHIIIMLHPICILAAAYYYNNTIISKDLLLISLIIYVFWILYYSKKIVNKGSYCTLPSKEGYLDWGRTRVWGIRERLMYFLPFIVFLLMKNKLYGYYVSILIALLITISIKKIGYNSPWESVWCFFGNSLPLYTIILGKIFYK
jgi:hypothetical protein